MASSLRIDAVPRSVAAERRQSAQPPAHPWHGYGNQAVGRMLATRRRSLQRVIDAGTTAKLKGFQSLVGPDEIGEIGASIGEVEALVAHYLAGKGGADDAAALTAVRDRAEALEALAIRMREDRSEHKTDTKNATPLGQVKVFALQLKREAIAALTTVGKPPDNKGERYLKHTEPTTTRALADGTMKHLLITPRPGTAEAEGGGRQFPETVTPDREMVLALPPKASMDAPFKSITLSGSKPPVLEVLAIGGGHGGVRALFDQEGFGNFSAKYWSQQVVDPLVALGVKAKLVVLDACLTASMFDVFAPLCLPKGRIIGSMYSINGRLLTPEVWQEIFDAEDRGDDVTPIVQKRGRELAEITSASAAPTVIDSLRGPADDVADMITREPSIAPIVSRVRYLTKISDRVSAYVRAKNNDRRKECLEDLRDITTARLPPAPAELKLASDVIALLSDGTTGSRDAAVELVRKALQDVTSSTVTDAAALERLVIAQATKGIAGTPTALAPAQNAVFDVESKTIRFDAAFTDKTARENVVLSTAEQSRGEMAGIDRELTRMASTGLAKLTPVPRGEIFD